MQRNGGVQIGYNDRLAYDKCYYDERIKESTAPLGRIMDDSKFFNCNKCMSIYGPRPSSGSKSFGVSTAKGVSKPNLQNFVDIENVLTNRNLKATKCRKDQVNPVNIMKLQTSTPKLCSDQLSPISTLLTEPRYMSRGIPINRFIDLPINPQEHIYWDISRNTRLEAIDCYQPRMPTIMPDRVQPTPGPDVYINCINTCN